MIDDFGVKHVFADNERYHGVIHVVESEEVKEAKVEGEDCVFLHLTINKWDKTTLKLLRIDLENVLIRASKLGVECVSFIVPKTIGTKFHNTVRPIDYEVEITSNDILAGWYTD